jgi:hypothetical protein
LRDPTKKDGVPGECNIYGAVEKYVQNLVGMPERKRLPGKLRSKR